MFNNNLITNLSLSNLYEERFRKITKEFGKKINLGQTTKIPLKFKFHSRNADDTSSDFASNKGEFKCDNYYAEIESGYVITKDITNPTFRKSFTIEFVPKLDKGVESESYSTINWYLNITLTITYSEPAQNAFFAHKLVTFPAILLLEPTIFIIIKKWMNNQPLPCELVSSMVQNNADEDFEIYDRFRRDLFIYPKRTWGS